MLSMWQFFVHQNIIIWDLPWKILKTVEAFFWYKISLENNITARDVQTCMSRTMIYRSHLSVWSQHSIKILSTDIVIWKLEMDNFVDFLLRCKLISLCWPVRIVKRHLFVNELASSRVQTVSVTTATTWCGTLNESSTA